MNPSPIHCEIPSAKCRDLRITRDASTFVSTFPGWQCCSQCQSACNILHTEAGADCRERLLTITTMLLQNLIGRHASQDVAWVEAQLVPKHLHLSCFSLLLPGTVALRFFLEKKRELEWRENGGEGERRCMRRKRFVVVVWMVVLFERSWSSSSSLQVTTAPRRVQAVPLARQTCATMQQRRGRTSRAYRHRKGSPGHHGRQVDTTTYVQRGAVASGLADDAGLRRRALPSQTTASRKQNVRDCQDPSQDCAEANLAADGKGCPQNSSSIPKIRSKMSTDTGTLQANTSARGRPRRETLSSRSTKDKGSVREKRRIFDSEICRHEGTLTLSCLVCSSKQNILSQRWFFMECILSESRAQVARRWHHMGT